MGESTQVAVNGKINTDCPISKASMRLAEIKVDDVPESILLEIILDLQNHEKELVEFRKQLQRQLLEKQMQSITALFNPYKIKNRSQRLPIGFYLFL